jgi:all-trans-8'-apo-beta-carotenal 15,15'-oxygenase
MSSNAAATMTPGAPDLRAIFDRSNASVRAEVDVLLEIVEGAVPAGLRGTLFRNGPGRLELGGVKYGHLFDGDGHINRFGFTDEGQIRYRNRFVRTREFAEEEAAGKILYRNFGTNIPGGLLKNLLRMRFKNAANTSVVAHAGALYALWEGGLPHRLDPETLATLGRDDLGGALQNRLGRIDRMISPELPFSAHPRRDQEGSLYNFGSAAGTKSRLCLLKMDPSGRCERPDFVDLDGMFFIHDFLLTENYRIFFLAPAAFDAPRTLLGLAPPIATFKGLPGPIEVLVIGKDNTRVRRFKAEPGFIFHFPNAYEDGDRIIIDGFRMDRPPTGDLMDSAKDGRQTTFPQPFLTRYVLNTRSGAVEERRLTEHAGELATVDPRRAGLPYRYTWAVGSPVGRVEPYHTGVLKVDVEAGTSLLRDFGPNMTGEPVFVPRPGGSDEDDGWLLSMIYVDSLRTNELLVLDARTLATLCRARLPHSTPLGFHGTFVAAA